MRRRALLLAAVAAPLTAVVGVSPVAPVAFAHAGPVVLGSGGGVLYAEELLAYLTVTQESLSALVAQMGRAQ